MSTARNFCRPNMSIIHHELFHHCLYRMSQSPTARGILTAIARTYLRYAPVMNGKEALWDRIINPYLAWHPREFVATTRFGQRMAGNTRDMLQQYVYYFGLWEPDLTDWISEQLQSGDTFIDVGANIGYYSLLASKRVGKSGKVVAVEASPDIFLELRGNLDRNRATNVRPVNIAAAQERGVLQLYRGPIHNGGETSLFEGDGYREGAVVTAAPLTEILEPCEINAARLIKLDIEGAEGIVLPGLLPLLKTGRPDLEIIVELHPQYLTVPGKTAADLVQLFRASGFYPYKIGNDYWPLNYLNAGVARRPTRFDKDVVGEMVIVFSRRADEQL
jgi:FkbM family methyltransferase